MRYPHLRSADRAPRRGWPAAHAAWPPLVAVAHGSTDPQAGATIADLVSLARARAAERDGAELDARAAFLGHAAPSVSQVLAALAGGAPARSIAARDREAAGARRPSEPVRGHGVIVLPLLLTAAFHSGTDIPAALREAAAAHPWLAIAYGQPLGPHPALLRVLESRLADAGEHHQSSDTAVVLAAAGSSQPTANAAVARMAADWQAASGWRTVVPAYASAASPTPGNAVAALLRDGAPRVVVASYLLAPGLFASRIRDSSLAAGAAAVSRPLGAAPEVADVLLERYAEARTGMLEHRCGLPGLAAAARVSARPAS
jgi:sirohydrochlorin ferrochelatase